MAEHVLRTVRRGGYDKTAVMSLLDEINNVRFAYEEGSLTFHEAQAQLTSLRSTPLPEGKGGFVQEDVDSCIADLCGLTEK